MDDCERSLEGGGVNAPREYTNGIDGGPSATTPDSSTDTVLNLRNVLFQFPNGLKAIDSISLSARRGEIVAIVGPSGCGKTTLLRLIGGLEMPTGGEIKRPAEVDSARADRHPCSMVFQEDTVLPWLRVRDNVALHHRFGRRLRWKRDSTVRDQVDHLIKMVGLDQFADFYPAKLSGGMKRRVAVLTALAPFPNLLLLDEPFSALDEPTRIGVHADVYRLIREFEVTAILVTHDLAEAISLSDRVLVLSRAPAKVVSEYTMQFDTPRDMLKLRKTDAFLECYGTIWSDLEREIRG